MKAFVFVNVQVPGLHHWPEAVDHSENHGYLQHVHRHVFHINVVKEVKHDNRDVEFFALQQDVKAAITTLWQNQYAESDLTWFGNCSCEMIAGMLLQHLAATVVQVSEDGENGAIVAI